MPSHADRVRRHYEDAEPEEKPPPVRPIETLKHRSELSATLDGCHATMCRSRSEPTSMRWVRRWTPDSARRSCC